MNINGLRPFSQKYAMTHSQIKQKFVEKYFFFWVVVINSNNNFIRFKKQSLLEEFIYILLRGNGHHPSHFELFVSVTRASSILRLKPNVAKTAFSHKVFIHLPMALQLYMGYEKYLLELLSKKYDTSSPYIKNRILP